MAERKFTRSLNKPGMAAQLRETVSQVVRETNVLNKPLLVEPIDFESFILKNKTLIQNDPQRELLLYPSDDVSQVILPRKFRTTTNNIPVFSLSSTPTSTTPSTTFGNTINGPSQSNSSTTSPSIQSLSSMTTINSTSTPTSDDDNLNLNNQLLPPPLPIGGSGGLLLTKQALHTYQSNNHLVHYKYNAYSGSCHDLPRITPPDELTEEIYEIDADQERIDEQMTRSQADSITKQGYLHKGPDSSSDRMFAHIGSKSFKRRYCYLRQEVDGTYILEMHKDEKQCEAKATIVMDFCTEVVQNPKRGRFCFELRMTAGHKSFTLAADNENDMQDWLIKLQTVLQQNKLQEDKQQHSLERTTLANTLNTTSGAATTTTNMTSQQPPPPPSPNSMMMFGTLKGLEQSMNPQLMKYGRETDVSIAQARRENRRRLFGSYQNGKKSTPIETIEPYREQFGQRMLIRCESLKFRLQAISSADDSAGAKETLCQVEPYITTLALYDARAGKKLTENFYFDINPKEIRNVFQLNTNCCNGGDIHNSHNNSNGNIKHSSTTVTNSSSNSDFQLSKELQKVTDEWLMYPKQAIINITQQHPDIFLVVKIDKVLQGGINNSTEPYLKATKDPKLGLKLHRTVRGYHQKIGHYRMPFAWAARPLFRLYSSDLDTAIEFPAIYRQDTNKLKDEEILKLLSEYRKPDKFSKLTVIPGWLKITIEQIHELPSNCLTTTLSPLKPFPMPPVNDATYEITEFPGTTEREVYPYTTFINHLFIYPLTLSFDSQKLFSRARNIAVVIELRESDVDGAKPLRCIYSRPGQKQRFLTQLSCPVIHHCTNPTWYEEIKLRLPLHITTQHHLLFSFIHISCDLSKKRDSNQSSSTSPYENPVGYAWLPLLNKGKINVDEQMISVAATLPSGYLAIQPLGLGKGNAGPDIQWIDNQRPLFTVTFRLDSTVLTTDQHLHNLFAHTERILLQQKYYHHHQQQQSASSTVQSTNTNNTNTDNAQSIQSASRIICGIPAESETCKILKAAHAIHVTSVITFLPTILNQLFILLVNTNSEEIGLNVIRLLINLIHMVADEAGRKELLLSYVKYVFQTSSFYKISKQSLNGHSSASSINHQQSQSQQSQTHPQQQQQQPHQNYQSHTVHSELCRHLPTLLHPNNTDFLIVNKFMKYSNIFVDIIIKSMAQYLMHTGRIRMHRNERFPREFPNRIESLFQVLVPYLFLRYKDLSHETQQLNGSLSRFIKRCLTFMDRGFVFKLIRMYMDRFSPGDPRQLQEYKFLFLSEICSHEHYIPLNLPFLLNAKNRPPEILQHFTLSEEFCRQHFLAGVLLQEVKSSLNEVGHIRRMALSTFKELLAKHDLDDRYQNKGQLARIAMLYTPWLGIVLENLNRIYYIDVNKYDKYRNKQMDATLNKSINRISNSGSSFVFSRECQTPPTAAANGHSYYNQHQQLLISSQNNLSSITSTPKSMASTKLNNRLTLHIDSNNNINNNQNNNSSPLNRQSMHLKDTNYFAVIAGQTGFNQLTNGNSQTSLDSECSTLSQDTAIIKNGDHHHHVMLVDMVNGLNNLGLISASSSSSSPPPHHLNGHNRSISVTQPSLMPPRLDKFSCTETKDLLICFLFIIKHLASEQMVMWWQNCTENEIQSFLTVLDLSLVYFRYVGKKNVVLNAASSTTNSSLVNGNSMTITNGNAKDLKFVQRSTKASTLPARMIPPSSSGDSQIDTGTTITTITGVNTLNHHTPQRENLLDEKLRQQQALQESVMTTEIGIIILDCLGLYTIQFRDKLVKSSLLPKIAKIYLRYLQLGQSETLSKHVFAAIRAFINNFSIALFKGNSMLCGQLVYELLKCCDSRLANVRQESCAILYLLMRSNFEFSGRKGLTRVHLQVIISVSQMIGNVIGLNNARFQESLSLINSYATSDKVMKGTGFPVEVKDLTKRVRTVLMATAQMQAHQMDPERLLELQYSLANSYASTPELRHTWLVTMARNHEQNGNLSEAACCNLHIAALMAEYLKLRSNNKTQQPTLNGHTTMNSVVMNTVTWGSESFERISRNVSRDERGLKLDSGGGQQDSQYTEQILLDQLKECAEYLDRAERYECLGFVYELIVPILNARRDYLSLSQCYEHLAHAYTKIIDVNRSGKRMLGRFYRVVFFGQIFFDDDHGIEYVYKEPKLTSLSEISERLYKQYKDKFGTESVRMIMDSSPVIVNDLDPKLAYIQLTHVIPYFCKDELECRQNEFEQNHDVDTFMFETPFTRNGTARGSVEEQWKRRTILTTTYSFPYVLKRIPIKEKQSIELSPIEVAIDEMQNRVAELEQVVLPPIDVKKLQLRLQGSVAVQVNAGPLAYAIAFLDPKHCDKFSSGKVEDLKEIFREFVSICNTALEVNGRMISNDQREYHSALKDNYQKLCCALSDLLDESFMPNVDDGQTNAHRNSIALFSAISGAPSNSSTA